MSELKSVALWHPDEKIFASWHDWFSSRGWMVIDVGESVSEVPEVGVWLVAWNEQFHRPQVRVEFEVRRQKFPQEVWCASVLRHHMDTVSLDELSLFGLDEVFCEEPLDEDLVEERLEFALRFALLPASRPLAATVTSRLRIATASVGYAFDSGAATSLSGSASFIFSRRLFVSTLCLTHVARQCCKLVSLTRL